MADLRYFTFLKGCNEVMKIVDIIYHKLAYILRFYQNHKKSYFSGNKNLRMFGI